MRLTLIIIFGLISSLSFAQKAHVLGKVLDLSFDNQSLAYVSVAAKGTSIGTLTGEDGSYSLELNPGNHTLVFSSIGYEVVEVPISVQPGEEKILNQGLHSDYVSIESVVINVVQSREKESVLLLEQKTTLEIKQDIGAQELSRKGVGDVATAVAKTAGVSKQEGSNNVYVRGLGDRYNSTSINGLPVPSNDPEKKNIDLNLFSTDIVEYIAIDKVYTSKLSGDFAGGNVDISSKNFKGNSLFEISLGSAINTNAVQKSGDFLLQDGPNALGYSLQNVPQNPLSGYNFENSLAPVKKSPFGSNLSLRAGKSLNLGKEGRLNLFATLGFDNAYEHREGINQSVSAQGAKLKSFHQEKFAYKTNTTGMFTTNYSLNDKHKLGYTFLFVNSSEQSRDTYKGFLRDIAEDNNGLVQRATYIQSSLFVNQLTGNHNLSTRTNLDWGASYNRVSSDMPDRTQNTMRFDDAQGGYVFAQNTITDSHRYFQSLTEDEIALNLALSYSLGAIENPKGKITLGYNGRTKQRDFEATQFNFRITGSQLTNAYNPNNLDAFFNQEVESRY